MAGKYWWNENENTPKNQPQESNKYWWNENTTQNAAQNIVDRVNSYLENHNKYVESSQARFTNRKGTYEDAYVSDSSSWLDSAKSQKGKLDAEAESIISYMSQYSDQLDKKWMDSVWEALNNAGAVQTQVVDSATKDNDYWSGFGTDDMLKTYGSAENAYKAHQVLGANQGKTTAELDKVLAGMEDSPTRNLISSYRASVNEDEMGKFDLAAGAKEVADLERAAETMATISNQYFHVQNNPEQFTEAERIRITSQYNALVKRYGTPEELNAKLNSKRKYYTDAKRVQDLTKYGAYTKASDFDVYADAGSKESGNVVVASRNNAWNYTPSAQGGHRNVNSAGDPLYIHMNDEEVKIYNYLYAKDKAKADGYLKALEPTLKARMDFANATSIVNINIPIIEDLAVIGSGLMGGLEQWATNTASFFTGEKNPESVTDYTNYFLQGYLSGAGDYATEETTSKIGKYAHSAATSIGNMAPSILASVALKSIGVPVNVANMVGTTALGVSAAGGAYADAIEKGYNRQDARTYSNLVGLSEATLQYLIGGISNLGGISSKIAGGTAKLATKVAAIDSSLLRVAAKLGLKGLSLTGNILGEIAEEEAQNILEPAFKAIIFGEDYDAPTMDEMIETAIVTALSTGALEGISTSQEVNEQVSAEREIHNNIMKEYGNKPETLINEGLQNDKDSKSYKFATKYQEKINGKKKKTLTGQQIRNLLAANQDAITDRDMIKIRQAAKNRLQEKGETGDLDRIAELATKYATGGELTRAEKSELANSEYGSMVAHELLPENALSDTETSEWARDIGTEKVNTLAYNVKKIVDLMAGNGSSAEYQSLEKRVAAGEKLSVSKSGQAVDTKTGNDVNLTQAKVTSFVKGKDGKIADMVLEIDGKKVKASEIEYANSDQAYLYYAVSKIENISPETATTIINDYNANSGQSVSEYLNGFDEAFNYGYHGYSKEDIGAGKFAQKLTDTQQTTAYELGKLEKRNKADQKAETIKNMRTIAEANAEKAEAQKAKQMSVRVYGKDGKLMDSDQISDAKQAAGIEVAKILHQLGLGTNFEFYTSYLSKTMKDKDNRSLRVYMDENGVEHAAPSGLYRKSDGTIRVDLNAYNGKKLTLNVLAHELTHFIQQWSTEKYQVLADFLIKTYEDTSLTMHKRVIREQNRLKNIRGTEVSYEEAFDEVVANAMMKMFDDGKLVERLTELKETDKNLAQKLWEGLKDILNKFFNLYEKESALFFDTADLMEMHDAFEQLQDMFAEALVEASENFQASLIAKEAEAISNLGENAKVETNEAGELLVATNESGNVVMYSEQTYLNGGRDKLEMALRQNGHTEAEIENTLSYVDDALDYIKILAAGYAKMTGYNALSNHLVADIITNVKTGKQVMSSIVNNGDYPVNIDLSLICKKRVAYMHLMSRLIQDGVFDKVNYDGSAIAEVNEILRDNGFETACLGCFVESRRLQFQTWAETIVAEWNAEVDKRNPDAENFGFAKGKMEELTDADINALTRELESVKKNAQGNVNLGKGDSVTKMGRLMDAIPSLQKKLTVEDLLTPEGLTALRKHDGSLFSVVKSRYGAASPKIVQDFNPYASEIAMLTFAQVKNITSNAVKGAQYYVTKVKNEYGTLTKTKGESEANFKKRKAAHNQKIQDEAMRRYLYDIGGARIQSFSDFMIENIFDYIQIFADLSAKRLPLHGYTKEIVCLRLFGMTGAKWNGSLIAHVERSMGKEFAGLLPAGTENGIPVTVDGKEYVIGFDDYARNAATNGKSFIQSIGMKDIIALQLDPRYSPYVGNITIGVSDAQILAMLDSPLFRMVIPYHASGMLPMFAKLVGVDMYNDYTDYQNTTVRQYYDKNGNAVSELRNDKGDTIKADTSYTFNAEIQKTKDAKIAANNYLKWCAQRHPVYDGKTLVGYATFNPKFSSSPYGTDFTRHENYYKLLEDFNTYDCVTEQSAIQGAVTMTFPSEENRLNEEQMEAYKAALRETGIFTEKDIAKYAKKADMTFKEIIDAEVGNRAEYAKTQAPKWEETVKKVEDKLQKDYAREMQSSQKMYDSGVKNGEVYSTQETDNISNRDLLANAFETLSRSSIEYEMIQDYKKQIKLQNMLDEELSKLNEQIHEMRFTKGKYDAEKIRKLEAKAERIAKDINKIDMTLVNMETAEPLRKLIQRERKIASEKTRKHIEQIQQNKKDRAERTELRHKIRKTVRDLDKLLNKGDKKKNVKEGMRSFVSKALELADFLFTDHISNDDLIRMGITVDLKPAQKKLVKETEDILSYIADNYGSITAEKYAELDAKKKKNVEKLQDVLKAQRNKALETPVYKLFDDLVTAYANLQNSSQEAVKAAYNSNTEMFLKRYMGVNEDGTTDTGRKSLLQDMRVADMTTEELEHLLYAYKMVLHTVKTANKLFVEGKAESIDQITERLMKDFSEHKAPEGETKIAIRNLANKIGWSYEKLYYALDRIGSEAFTELVMNIANSENTVMQNVMEAVAFRDEIVNKYGFNSWKINKEIDREFLDNNGKKFKLTLGQLMSLYAYSRRKGAWDHIKYGGFSFKDAKLTNPKPADSYKLTKDQCKAITDLLTAEQKAYVEDMQKFLSETMGKKGNEVSMLLYGIKLFGEENYFPIHIDGRFMENANESQAKAAAGFGTMSNAGFTHAQNPKAKAPFLLESFNDVWADHVNEMSRYHGTVPALEDFRRVMNRASYMDGSTESQSMYAALENHFGKDAADYFRNLYQEANSGAITDKMQTLPKKLLSLFRKNSVAYSLSVIIQQPSALFRAYAMIPYKYFGGVKNYKRSYDEMLKYAPGVTMAKEIGGFDTHTGTSIREYLLDTNKSFKQSMKTENLAGKGKAVMGLVDDNAIANLPNVTDKIAWVSIWNACKKETIANHKDLATNSEEFMKIVGDRFTEVIRATQVYDSMFSKSPMLKSKNLAVQYLVSFMNEPNTTANMVEKAIRDAKNGNVSGGLKIAGAVSLSIIANNVLKSIVYAMRDDDEDETYIEKYVSSIANGMLNDINPFNYIPGLRDVWSLAQGYDVERADMAIVADALDAAGKVIKNAFKDTEDMAEEELAEFDKKVMAANWNLVESMASFFGIPMKNVRREVKGFINHARIASKNAGMTTSNSFWDKVEEGVFGAFYKEAKADRLYDAIMSGDAKYVERIKGTYKTNDAYNTAVRKALRENDPRIHDAAQARYDGKTEEAKRIFREIQAEGKFDSADIISAINSEEAAIKKKAEPEKAKSTYTETDYVEAITMGNASEAKTIMDDIITTKVANGKTQTEAEKEFKSSVTTSVRDTYYAGLLDDAEAEQMLIEYTDMDEEDAASRVNYWVFCEDNPKYKDVLTESNVNGYQEFAEPAGVSVDVYAQFVKNTKGLTDIKDKNGDVEVSKREQVLDVIDSLPITRKQKDAIYLAAGYAESKIWDVPW